MKIEYSRGVLLEWLRAFAPDLRLGYALVDGQRRAFARFTFAGQLHELESTDDDAIVRDAVERIRAVLELSPLTVPARRDVEERDIVVMALRGHTDQADALGRALVMKNAAAPNALHVRTQFGRGKTW